MDQSKKPAAISGRPERLANDDDPPEQRRRISRIVHDERGNASVQWYDAPGDYERPVFEVETNTARMRRLQVGLGAENLSLETERAFNPYSNPRPLERKSDSTRGTTSKTDLRKLSAWIKMMRELEARKKLGPSADDDSDD